MTTSEVRAVLGSPLKEVKARDGKLTWGYPVKRTQSSSYSYSDFGSPYPGESSYDRQNRLDQGRFAESGEVSTTYQATNWIEFDRNGRLERSYRDDFVKGR